MQGLWMTVFYEPLYNGLIFFVEVFPWHSVGLAVILLTLLVKIILFPLAQKSIKSQVEMKKIEPLIEKLKKENPKKEDQARKTMELYKEHKINPFSGCLVLLIQIPIIFALYKVFMNGIYSPEGVLYSFIHLPEQISTMFLGAELTGKSIGLAIAAGLSQFLQAHIANARLTPVNSEEKSFKNDFMKSMQFQMKYVLPVFIAIVSYTLASAVALYWVTSNLFTVMQEYIIRQKVKKELELHPVQ